MHSGMWSFERGKSSTWSADRYFFCLFQQIEKLNVEKLQLQSDLQVLRDENMTYRHEVMVLVSDESEVEAIALFSSV